MYNSIEDLCLISEENNQPVWHEIMREEMRCTGKTEEEIWEQLSLRYDIMKRGTENALGKSESKLRKTLITGMAKNQYSYAEGKKNLCGSFLNKMMARALSLS